MKVSFTPAGAQKMTFSLMGAQEVTASAAFDSSPTDLTYAPFDGFSPGHPRGRRRSHRRYHRRGSGDKQRSRRRSVSARRSGQTADIPEGTVAVTGTLKARFTSLALYTKAINDTASSLKLIFARGDGTGTAENESLEFYIPELTFTPKAPPISGPKGIIVELPFVGYYGTDVGESALQITLKKPDGYD